MTNPYQCPQCGKLRPKGRNWKWCSFACRPRVSTETTRQLRRVARELDQAVAEELLPPWERLRLAEERAREGPQ